MIDASLTLLERCTARRAARAAKQARLAGHGGPKSSKRRTRWSNTFRTEGIPGFQLKRVRSGVETLLAAHGVSREIRGQLQSHGRTG